MGPIEQLVEERLPPERAEAVREFAKAYLRRLSADDDGHDQEALFHEVVGAFQLAAARNGAPIAVRALNPTREEHGYEPAGSVLETNTEDLPFLLDSVSAELQARGLGIVRVLHPIVGTERDPDGGIARVLHPRGAPATESVMHFELDRRLTPEELADLEDAVRSVLDDVRRVVRDFPALRARVDDMVEVARQGAARYDAEEVAEVVDFLEWLARDNFIFLGARDYELVDGALQVLAGSGLGLLDDETRSAYAKPVPADTLDTRLRERALGGDLLLVSKTNRLSPVHRRARMDYIGIRRVGAGGEVVGEARMIGLFTTKAYAEPASESPLLHRKLTRMLAAEDLIEGSHDYKAAVALFESFPKDELFAAPTEDLRRAVVALLGLHPDQGRVLGRLDADGRSASIIVALPRGRYDTTLIERLRAFLTERFDAAAVDAHEVLGEEDRVRVHLTVHRPQGNMPDVSFRELEAEILELTRTWDDRAREELVARHGDERGRMLAKRWTARLPDSYKAAVPPSAAADDIANFERLFTGGAAFHVGVRNEHEGLTRIGMYRLGGKVELSQAMPILEHLGLRVVEERPTRLQGGDGETWLQDFGVLGPTDRPLDLEECGQRLAESIAAVWRGETESDSLNRLVISAGLDWRRIAILRAYRSYRQRIGSRFTEGYQNDVLAANPHVIAKLIRLFELRNDPSTERDEQAEAALREDILADLEAVPSLDHDRILRNQLGLVEATVRTNVYRHGRRSIAFKLRSAEVPAIPQPPPLFEIYVYAPEVEGIHLRGGKIARGGLRWSDRMDYRTEVFGLMRAQMTKNAVIVPDGAKGGFYLRRRPDDPGALKAEVERGYVTFVSGLLDLTDNLVEGAVVHPEGVRVLDDDDTYLVVAADKGTATFSDTANRIAGRYGFWLGDAFASGGSKGYDHKALGITARGAWESLKRHFSELDLDPAVDEFTAVGIGDMSGDVFGNGMLLSDKIRLVAAYDHRHVFIDPDPDAATGFLQRKRLFEMPGSSWDDYERDAISAGGGVWQRSAKRIELSEQARAALDIEAEVLTPNEVIQAILRARVDVLWNGGIGTVVKASTETDADALDRSSDAIRVDAADLRCRVVAEGGNLGFTQRARIEYARAGGRINADFIDNSSGVDCSDHEVNLKILLDLAVRRGELDGEGRDALLAEVTDDVAAHVLYDSFLQAQILVQEVRASASRMFAYEDLMESLEAEGLLHRKVEFLPSSEEMADRRRSGRGLERPELAVLLAYAKRSLTDALLRSALPDDPYLDDDLRSYFPPAVVERFGALLPEHPLRRELVATIVANDVVNALGPTFVSRLVSEQGAEPADVVRAYRIARDVTGSERRWSVVEQLDRSVESQAQWQLMEGVDALMEATSRWYLENAHGADLGAAIAAGREGFARVVAVLPDLPESARREARERDTAALAERGVPEEIARAYAYLPVLSYAPDIITAAQAVERPVEEVAAAFSLMEDRVQIGWIQEQLEELPVSTRMQRWALHALRDDLWRARRELVQHALAEAPGVPVAEAIERFADARPDAMRRVDDFARMLSVEGAADLAGLTLAVRQLRALAD
ncbi:MAG TPA: NAD-glutamate dehydrogenase [Solirubrobacteraceae bacterium]